MNKRMWQSISRMSLSKETKQKIFLFDSVIIYGLLGGIVWLLLGQWILPDISWAICFVGYSAVFAGFFKGILFLYNQDK